MNNLIINNEINTVDMSKQIYAFISAGTPSLYKNKTVDEVKAEVKAIEMFTSDIPANVLSKMCELARKYYVRDKGQDPKLVFDIHYILSKYKCAEYLVRNGFEDFEFFISDLDSVEV